MIYQYFLCVLFLSPTVHGQISLTVPAAGYCGNTTKLTCTVTGTVATSHTWTGPPGGSDILTNGLEVVVRNKHSEVISGNQFSLIISDTNVTTDEGGYTCTNNFDISTTETLKCECLEGLTISKDGGRMKIDVSEAYPNTVDVTSVSLLSQGEQAPVSIAVTQESLTQNGEYFHVVWISDEIEYGTYNYTVTIKAVTEFVYAGEIVFGTTTTSTTATTITTPTTSMMTSSTTATTTSSMPTSTTSISTSTTSTTAQSTATSTQSTVKAPSTSRDTVTRTSLMITTVPPVPERDSDKGLITMIIVVSVMGGVLIVAIFSVMFVMMHWKSCFIRKGHSKQYAQRSEHRKQHRPAEYNASGRYLTTRQDPAIEGYYFYKGTYKNPLFREPFENSSIVNNYYPNQKNSNAPKYVSSHDTYQYGYNWE